jgi:cytochrome b6-f complex iron-sulfur subunit
MSDATESRRQFCVQACRLSVAAGVAALGQACGGSSSPTSPTAADPLPAISGTASGNAVTVVISSGSPLAAVGGAALVQSSRGSFLVTRTGQDSFLALSATCTHEACTITGFSSTSQRYVCPCHGSTFDTSGRVLNGPAVATLRQFPASLAGSQLTIAA